LSVRRIAERGPPLLTASLVAAARQAQFWRRVLDTDAFSGGPPIELAAACDVIDRAASCAVSNSLFAGFISRKPLMPSQVIGVRGQAFTPP
jgi:hypothetical protein